MKISQQEFKKVYFSSLQEILKIRPIDQHLKDMLAIYDYGYKDYDLINYLEKSWFRAWQVYNLLPDPNRQHEIKILDLGGFFGNFSFCFQKLGYKTTITDVYDYYQGVFDNLKNFLQGQGIKIMNRDFTALIPIEELSEKYDVILCLAVLEHLAHSPAALLYNIKNSLKEDGSLILEVSNITYWYKRLQLLQGGSILPSVESIYKSKEPFIGHHHEYTKGEIEKLATLSGFEIEKMIFYNYSVNPLFFVIHPIFMPAYLFKSCKEIILAKLKIKPIKNKAK